MEEKNKVYEENKDVVEYEDVKRMPMGAFIGMGLAFGVAGGFAAGKLLFGTFAIGMVAFLLIGAIGGFVFGLINKSKRKPE